MSYPPCRLSMQFPRMDYHDYISRVGNRELLRLLIEKEQQLETVEEASPTISDDASTAASFSSETTPMGPLAQVADGADSTEVEEANVVFARSSTDPDEPSTSPPPPDPEIETARASDVSMSSPASSATMSIVSRRSKNASTSSRSSHTHKWLSGHSRTVEASSPPQPPQLTVTLINATPHPGSSKGKGPATSSPPRSHQALESLQGILQNSKTPRIFPRSELRAPENETPAHKRRKTLFSPSPRKNSPNG